MNVLLLDQFSDAGGAQRCLLELLPGIQQRGWRALAAFPGNGELFAGVQLLGIQTAPLRCGPYASGRKTFGDVIRFIAGTPQLARRIRCLAERLQPSVVYVNGPRLLPAVALARLRAPVVFHTHSYLSPGAPRTIAGESLVRTRASVVGSCEFVAGSWRGFVPASRVSVIYNGVAGPARSLWKANHGAPRIACIGRIAPEKGQSEFLQAAALIRRQLPQARFSVYGATLFGDDASLRYARQIRTAAAGLPVDFPGWVGDVYQALAGLDLLLVPSASHEATTRVILEAFAAGVPVIAFRSGGVPEVVEHGRNGFLVDSPSEMSATAVRLLTGDCSAISKAARETWSRRFTLDRYRKQVLDTLERCRLDYEFSLRSVPKSRSGRDASLKPNSA